jgi:hypothetical protein
VIGGELFETGYGSISDTVAAEGIPESFVFAGKASVFVGQAVSIDGALEVGELLLGFTAAFFDLLGEAAFHGGTGVFGLQGFEFDLGVDEAAHFADVTLHATDFTAEGGELCFQLATAVAHGVANVASSVIITIALIASSGVNGINALAQPSLQVIETLRRFGLGRVDAVVQTGDLRTVAASMLGEVDLLITIQAIPAIAREEEEEKEDEHEHAFTAPAMIVAALLAESEEAGNIHVAIALNESEKAGDVVHRRLLRRMVIVHSVGDSIFELVNRLADVVHVVTHKLLLYSG